MLIKLLTEARKGRQNSSAKRSEARKGRENSSAKRDKYLAPPGKCQFLTEARKGRQNSSAKRDKYGGEARTAETIERAAR